MDEKNYYYKICEDKYVKTYTSNDFGTSEFMEKHYTSFDKGEFIHSMEYIIWERYIDAPQEYPQWLIETGNFYYELYGFDDSASMIEFINKLK